MKSVLRCTQILCVVGRLLGLIALVPLASAQGTALPEHRVSDSPAEGLTDPSTRELSLFGDSASPDKWLMPESALTQWLDKSGSSAQLLISVHTILRYDWLLQPNFFAAGPLSRLLGAAPKNWREHMEQVGGKIVRVRDASITVPAGVRALTATIHEEIRTPRDNPVVLSNDSGGPPPDQKISASITISLKPSTQICVCDVRDWMGFETRSELTEGQAGKGPSEKGVLVYEYVPRDAQPPVFTHKSARFTIRQDTNSDSQATRIYGQDLVTGFTIAEEGR